MCGFLVFVCAQNTGSDYRLYIMVSDLFLEKRSEKILVPFSIFSSFLSFFLPLFMCSFLLLLIYSVFHFCHRNFFSSSYFLISFCPLFLCFCFVVTHIIGAFHPSSFFRVFLNLFAFFLSFVISSSCPAPASSLPSFMISFFRSFFLCPLCINSK